MKKILMSEIEFSALKKMEENEMRVLVGGKGGKKTIISILIDLLVGGGDEESNGNCGCNGNCPSC